MAVEECSPTHSSLGHHGYGGPTGCPSVELCTSWHGWREGWHLPSFLPSRTLMPHEGHPRLPGSNVGQNAFSPSALVNCVGSISASPFFLPPFTHTNVLDEPKNYKYIHVSPTSPTWEVFTTLHRVHVSPTSPTWVLFTTLQNTNHTNSSLGMHNSVVLW